MLKDRVIIITGSTRGIGKSIALELAKDGAKIVVNGTNSEEVNNVVNELRALGHTAIGVPGRVQEMSTGRMLVKEAVKAFGGVDVLINNAGNVKDQMTHRLAEEDWDSVIDVHLKGTFSCTKAFIDYQKSKGGGMIMNMTSLAGVEGSIGQLNYSAAKAGIIGMTKTLAKELKRMNIKVVAIAPAALTDMTIPHVEKARKKAEEKGEQLDPYWEIGMANDVAYFIKDIILNRADFESGEIYSVNGKTIGKWESPKWMKRN
ncbi:3-oxoacyl-[acyl-carrier protein] reductase [Bacillus pakistanensis]|uniref:3-oxoacyl-[acyl-carrier protein] reductase n=1 Tax=Rossellomorea pakistanensis TaxID=992288 RepID=A0ABS2NEV9_9BACI|nr:SDR family NAD(P)-dependent oxidoreductase [Bacillus pakistanensis]MBM7586396.1 3-oxoacyl-[acyl-carrier protein] reductase [Bacillus pakistanensis]